MPSQQNISQRGLGKIPKLGIFPPPPNNTLCSSSIVGLASLALAGLQVDKASVAPLFVLWLLPLHALPAAFDFISFPLHAFLLPLVLFCFSFMHFLLLWLCLVFFFMCFLLLWLCTVSPYFTFHKIRIHPYPLIQRHYGLSAIYWVRLVNPFCFLFSSII